MKFHIHDWGKWSLPFDLSSDYKKAQSRCCNVCNKVEVQSIKQPWNQWFQAATLIAVMKESAQ